MVLSLPSAARPTHKGQNAVHYSLTEGGTCYLVLIKCRHGAAFKCAYTLLSVRQWRSEIHIALLTSYVPLTVCPGSTKRFAGFCSSGVDVELERGKGLAMCLAHSAGAMDVPIIKSDHKRLQ